MNKPELPGVSSPAQRSIPTLGIIALLLCICMLPGANAWSAGLTQDQVAAAAGLARQTDWHDASIRRVQVSHPLGRQILSIEKQESKATAETRLVRVYEFDYTRKAARLLVIDLLDLSIQREQVLGTVHLPLNQSEIDLAIARLAQDEHYLQSLRQEQIQRGRTPFSSLSELDVKASIYEPGPHGQSMLSQDCRTQRCALLSLFDDSHTVFSLEPVVNLDTLELHRLNQP